MGNLCLTFAGVQYEERDVEYGVTLSNDGKNDASRRLRCKWSDQATLANALLTNNGTNITVGSITFQVGQCHPLFSGLFASSVKISPTDGTRQFAWLDVAYKPLEFNPASPAIVREDRIGLSSEVLPLMKESVKFASGRTMDRDSEFLLTYLKYSVTLKGVSTVPIAAIYAALNTVHSGTMNFRVGSGSSTPIPGDQVLFQGVEDIAISYTSSGSQKFDVTYNFLVSPISLQKEYNPFSTATNVFDRFETVTPDKYGTTNLSLLGV